MKTGLLLPHKFKLIGWCLLIPATIAGIFLSYANFDALHINGWTFAIFNEPVFGESKSFGFIKTNMTNTIAGSIFIIGAMFVGFSKEKREDEFIAKLRLSSLMWAVWVNYFLLLLSFLFVYGTAFFNIMLYNMFTVLIIFITRFNYILYKNSKPVPDEK